MGNPLFPGNSLYSPSHGWEPPPRIRSDLAGQTGWLRRLSRDLVGAGFARLLRVGREFPTAICVPAAATFSRLTRFGLDVLGIPSVIMGLREAEVEVRQMESRCPLMAGIAFSRHRRQDSLRRNMKCQRQFRHTGISPMPSRFKMSRTLLVERSLGDESGKILQLALTSWAMYHMRLVSGFYPP